MLLCLIQTENKNLPLNPDKKWLNMQKIEYEKLEWTKDMKAPTAGDSKVTIIFTLIDENNKEFKM